MNKLSQMINQEFKAQREQNTYQLLPNFLNMLQGARRLKVTDFAHACAVSALSCSGDM